jgi:hypothetical protein
MTFERQNGFLTGNFVGGDSVRAERKAASLLMRRLNDIVLQPK